MGTDARAKRRLLLIELNEFDPEFVLAAGRRLGLKNFEVIAQMTRGTTSTADRVEHQGLDPWVQWVNVHSGLPSERHKIKRLGQTTRQEAKQLWTVLGERGYSWGVWGAMNAPRQSAPGCAFFFPDPWSFEEEACPSRLNELLALPRYMSKNYLDADPRRVLREAARLTMALISPEMWGTTLSFSRHMMAEALRVRLSLHGMATFLDYLCTLVFVDRRRRQRPDFSLIFLNNIAHLQHQFWSKSGPMHPEMELGLRLTDKMIGLLMKSLDPSEAVIIMNGLKQKNVDGEGYCVYRQRSPQGMLAELGLPGVVEQCMTHDAHVLCATAEEADQVERGLAGCHLRSGTPAFYVERVSDTRVFYQIDFECEVAPDEELTRGNQALPLSSVIELYARRTGAHIPDADVFYRGVELPGKMWNHEIYSHILRHFGISAARESELA